MKQKGFTLIEMMIVIAIIGILLSIIIPAFSDKDARSAKAAPDNSTYQAPEDTLPPAVEPTATEPLTESCLNGFMYVRSGNTIIQKMGADNLPAQCS